MMDIWCDKVFDSSWKQADTWTEGQNNHLILLLELVQAFYYVMDWKFLFACLFVFSVRNRVWKNRLEAMPSAQAVQSSQSHLMWLSGLALLASVWKTKCRYITAQPRLPVTITLYNEVVLFIVTPFLEQFLWNL